MNKEQNTKAEDLEQLSALMDSECSVAERVLDEAAVNSAHREKWQSYHLIRNVMQNERHSALPADFADLVSAKIVAEPNIANGGEVVSIASARSGRRTSSTSRAQQPSQSSSPRWLPFAGLGLAASVAAAGFVGWQVFADFDGGLSQQDVTVAQLSAPADNAAGVENTQVETGLVRTVYRGDAGTRWVAVSGEQDSQVEQRLNSLLLNHLEDSSMTRVQGMVVHTRLVGYDTGTVNESF